VCGPIATYQWRAYSFSALFILDEPLNHKKGPSLAPSIFYVSKKWQLKDRRLPIKNNMLTMCSDE